MLSRRLHIARRDQGFTLIETLVAMLTGLIVTFALFAILEVSLRQTSRLTERTQAAQLGRSTMTKMVDELHAACIAPKFTPVVKESNGSRLIFVNSYYAKATSEEATTAKTVEHMFLYSAAKTASQPAHSIAEFSYASTSGTWPNYKYSETATKVGTKEAAILGENIYPISESAPIFRYYKYNNKATSSTSTPLSDLESTPMVIASEKEGLTVMQAPEVASVKINFNGGPSNGSTVADRGQELSSQVLFSFSVPSAETPVEAFPCE